MDNEKKPREFWLEHCLSDDWPDWAVNDVPYGKQISGPREVIHVREVLPDKISYEELYEQYKEASMNHHLANRAWKELEIENDQLKETLKNVKEPLEKLGARIMACTGESILIFKALNDINKALED
jgi:FtsZ-binding cell division protein ZapB